MLVRDAQEIARKWVRENAEPHAHFRGAFFSGSINTLSGDSKLSRTSDVDVVVVYAGATVPPKPGKLLYRDILLEITNYAFDELADAEHVATTFYLAPSFARHTIISDPTGHLLELHRSIAASFAEPAQIQRRCDNVIKKIESGLTTFDNGAPWCDQILRWMFPTSLSAVAILVAGKENPTVRTRYLAAKKLLDRIGMPSVHEDLLELLGCREVSRVVVQHQLDALRPIFDAAAAIRHTGFFFSSDISPVARPITIDGSQNLIDAGHHREAVFWIVATYARCAKILEAGDATEAALKCRANFQVAAADLLNIDSLQDLGCRRALSLAFLPTLHHLVRDIIRSAEI